jgi:hypothetical protein
VSVAWRVSIKLAVTRLGGWPPLPSRGGAEAGWRRGIAKTAAKQAVKRVRLAAPGAARWPDALSHARRQAAAAAALAARWQHRASL